MRDIIDDLIQERAPWLERSGMQVGAARRVLHILLQYERTIKIGEVMETMPGADIMKTAADMFAHHVDVSGLENLPTSGAAMVVCNHPTGIADGIVLYRALAKIRPDLFFFANSDALRVFPQLESVIAPVEWREDKRSHKQNRETMTYAHRAFKAGRLGVLFPSGRLAKRRWLSLHERPWMPSGAMLARRFDLPIVPLHITARNSVLFYLFDRIHPTLRDITLFHEVLNKVHQPYSIRIGTPLDPACLPSGSVEATEVMRQRTLELGGERPQTVLTAPRYGHRRRLKPARLTI